MKNNKKRYRQSAKTSDFKNKINNKIRSDIMVNNAIIKYGELEKIAINNNPNLKTELADISECTVKNFITVKEIRVNRKKEISMGCDMGF